MISRRQFIIGAAMLGGVGARPLARAFGSTPPALTGARLRVAEFKGGDRTLLRAAGLDDTPYRVDWTEMASGTKMLEAVNAGAIDLAYGSEIPPIFARASETPLRIVAVIRGDVNEQVVLVPKNSAIRSIAELRGKKVGYVRGTTTHYYLLRMLDEAGLGFSDIDAVNLTPVDGHAAFASGALDAWAIYGYSVPLTIQATEARVLKTALGYLSGNYLYFSSPEAVADPQRHAAIADLLGRLQRAVIWQTANPDAYAAAQAPEIGVPAAVIRDLLLGASQPRRINPIDPGAIRSQQEVADVFTKAGILPHRIDVAPMWDTSFTDRLAKGMI